MLICKMTGNVAPMECVLCWQVVFWTVTLWIVKCNVLKISKTSIRTVHVRYVSSRLTNETDLGPDVGVLQYNLYNMTHIIWVILHTVLEQLSAWLSLWQLQLWWNSWWANIRRTNCWNKWPSGYQILSTGRINSWILW